MSTFPTIYNASTVPALTIRLRVLSATSAVGLPVQLALAIAALLLLVDSLSTGAGSRVGAVALGALGAAGVVANLGSLILALSTDASLIELGVNHAAGRVALVLRYLAPALLAAFTAWVSLAGGGAGVGRPAPAGAGQ